MQNLTTYPTRAEHYGIDSMKDWIDKSIKKMDIPKTAKMENYLLIYSWGERLAHKGYIGKDATKTMERTYRIFNKQKELN